MRKFWQKEKSNHHFPELNRKMNVLKTAISLFTPKKLVFFLIVSAAATGFFYLIQTNQTAMTGYQIKDLQQKASELAEQNKKLNKQYIELQSMANIMENAGNLNLAAGGQVQVLIPGASAVALSR